MSLMQFRKVRDFHRVPQTHRKLRFTAAEIQAFNKHGWFCHYCQSQHALTTDHIIPRSAGGADTADNLVPACAPCNTSRGHKPYEDFLEIIEAEKMAFFAMKTCEDCL